MSFAINGLEFFRDAVWCRFMWVGDELSLCLVQVVDLPERSYLMHVIINLGTKAKPKAGV